MAAAKLPDNITTFRVMAVAVTAGDRYGSGHSPMLVTRPLIARPALPRFVRAGDRFSAGVVVNQRAGGTPEVRVEAATQGITTEGATRQTARLEAGRGREVRFGLAAPVGLRADSVSLRFDVSGAGDRDAVRAALPVRPAFHPRSYTIAGTLADSATVAFLLPAGMDPDRSRLTLSFGASPLVFIRNAWERLRVYPYYCTEQVVSAAQPIIALYRGAGLVRRRHGDHHPASARHHPRRGTHQPPPAVRRRHRFLEYRLDQPVAELLCGDGAARCA